MLHPNISKVEDLIFVASSHSSTVTLTRPVIEQSIKDINGEDAEVKAVCYDSLAQTGAFVRILAYDMGIGEQRLMWVYMSGGDKGERETLAEVNYERM